MSTLEPPVEGGAPKLDHRDATYYAIPRRRRPVMAGVLWSLFAVAALALAGVIFADRNLQYALDSDLNNSPEVVAAAEILEREPKSLGSAPWNILLIGSDKRAGKDGGGDGGRGDSIILVRLDSKRDFISMLSFPRDLFVEIPGHSPNKINAAYAFGGPKLVIQTVEQLTGERIHHFFNIDFEAFRRLVNDSGGVYLDIDRWYFNDNAGRGPVSSFEPLDIKPGYQKLNGFDALDYVRYRKGDSDFGRIARQQLFLAELKRASRSVSGLQNILDAVRAEVTTSLRSSARLRDFIIFGLETEKERISRVTIKSSGQRDTACCGNVVDTTDTLIREAVDEWKNPVFLNDEAVPPADPAKTIVWVYNGSKKVGVGVKVADALEKKGYLALFAGDAPEGFYPSTSIYYAPERRNAAKALQPLFGQNASVAQRRSNQAKDADVLIMVGADYEGLVAPKKPAPATKRKPDTVTTTSLKNLVVNARKLTGMDLRVPTHLPTGSSVRYVRLYNVDRGDRGKPDALTIVVQLPRLSRLGGNSYVTITQTSKKNVPLLKSFTGRDPRGGGLTFYNGKNMQRLLWQQGAMTYWISNSLDESLTAETIRDMRQFMVRPARIRIPAGTKNVNVPVAETSQTP